MPCCLALWKSFIDLNITVAFLIYYCAQSVDFPGLASLHEGRTILMWKPNLLHRWHGISWKYVTEMQYIECVIFWVPSYGKDFRLKGFTWHGVCICALLSGGRGGFQNTKVTLGIIWCTDYVAPSFWTLDSKCFVWREMISSGVKQRSKNVEGFNKGIGIKFSLVFYPTSSHLPLLYHGVLKSVSPNQHIGFCSNTSTSYVNSKETEIKYSAVQS